MDKLPFDELYTAINEAWEELKHIRRQLREYPDDTNYKRSEKAILEWLEEAEREYVIRLKRLKMD